jgi:predicted kinase
VKPPLVMVTGMPGTGKTTLSQVLAARLFLPLVAKDPIKESLSRLHDSDQLRLASRTFEVMHDVAAEHLRRDVGIVLESAFVPGVSEPEVAVHLTRSTAVDVHCTADLEVVRDRFVTRAQSPERHASHPDLERLTEHPVETWPARYGPLDLDIPRLVVDTTDGYQPSLAAIIQWVEERVAC